MLRNKDKFSKKDINDIFKKVLFYECKVRLTRLSTGNNKSNLDNTTKEDLSIDEEPAKKKQKLDTNGVDIIKLAFREGESQFESKVKSLLKPNKGIASTRTEEVPTVIDCATESANSSAENVRPKIRVNDPLKIIDETYLGSNKVNEAKPLLNGINHVKWDLIEIEKLHNEYFKKSIQVTIVIIANLLNVISISNEHFKARLNESTKKRFEAEKMKYVCNARRLRQIYNNILEKKLKNKFIDIISSFEESEFYSAFIMFFLSILTVLRVLDQPKFGNGQELFEIVKNLLLESLINNECNHPKIFSTFQSITFYSDCTNVLRIINDSRNTDPGVTDRMPLYFLKTTNSLEYFKAVINAVTVDSNEDLSLLIENATFQCYYSSEGTDPGTNQLVSSTVQHSNYNIPATETIQSPINSKETINDRILFKNQDETYTDIPVLNCNKSQVIDAVEPLIVTSQPLTSFYKPHFSSLQEKTSKVIPTKKCIVVTPTTISNSPLVQVKSSMSETATLTQSTTTCQLTNQNKKSVANNYLHSAVCNTIVIDNKPYQLIKDLSGQLRAVFMPTISNSPSIQVTASPSETATITTCQSVNEPSGQMRAVDNGTLISVISPPTVFIRCDTQFRLCNNSATITCKCRKVNYCSDICRKLNWTLHYADCEE